MASLRTGGDALCILCEALCEIGGIVGRLHTISFLNVSDNLGSQADDFDGGIPCSQYFWELCDILCTLPCTKSNDCLSTSGPRMFWNSMVLVPPMLTVNILLPGTIESSLSE